MDSKKEIQHVYLVGAKSLGAYGGYETFVYKLTEYHQNINLKGTYFMCQTVAKYMIENKIKGHILIISSQSALEPSWSPYRLSKLGIDGITKGMAQRLLEHGIIVNAIGPGPTNTSMQKNYREGNLYTPLNPIKRFTTPEEIAQIAKILVSDLGNTIVGQTIYEELKTKRSEVKELQQIRKCIDIVEQAEQRTQEQTHQTPRRKKEDISL